MEQLAHLLQNHFQVLEERPICLEIAGMPSAEPFTRPICLQIAGTPSAQPTSGGRTPYLPPDSSGMETLTLLSDIASAYCLGSSRCSATTGWIFELLQKNDKVIERITSNIRMNSVWSIILTFLLEDIRHHSFTYSMDTGIHTSSKNQTPET